MPMSKQVACLSLDLEPDLRDPSQRIRLLDDDSRLQALIALLKRENIPLTIFTVMKHAGQYLDRLNALARETSVEYAVHSYSHDTENPASEYEIRSSYATFGELWNAPPLGYRSPNCLIDVRGIDLLAREGFLYDSSIVPSLRPDRYSYNNLGYPREPFRFKGPSGELLEFPIATLGGLRLPVVFSYVKLLGLPAYKAAFNVFPLPNVVVTYFHAYDLYVGEIAQHTHGWKRLAHMRNAANATTMLSQLISTLKARGYTFATMKDVAARLKDETLTTRDISPEGQLSA